MRRGEERVGRRLKGKRGQDVEWRVGEGGVEQEMGKRRMGKPERKFGTNRLFSFS